MYASSTPLLSGVIENERHWYTSACAANDLWARRILGEVLEMSIFRMERD